MPQDQPVAALVADLVDRLAPGAPLGGPGDVWALHRLGRGPLDPALSLGDTGALDGELLHLSVGELPRAPQPVDDPLLALAHGARQAARWSPRALELAAAVGLLLAAVLLLGLSLLVPGAAPAVPLLVGGGLLVGAYLLAARGPGGAATAFACAAAAVVALSAAGLAAAALGRPSTAGLLAATSLGTALGGGAAWGVLPSRSAWWAAAVAAGATGAVAVGLTGTGTVSGPTAAGVTAVVWLVALAAVPWAVARRSLWRRQDAPSPREAAGLVAAASRTRHLLDGATAGGAAAIAAAGTVLALTDDGLARGLAAAVAVVVAVRARRTTFLVASAAQLLAGAVVGAALGVELAAQGSGPARLVLLVAVAGVLAGAPLLGLRAGRADASGRTGPVLDWWNRARTRRLLDVVEYAAAVAVLPLLLGVLGVYEAAADAGAGL